MEQIYNFNFWKFQGEWKRSKIGIPGEWGKHQNCKGPPRNSEIPRGLEICMLGIPGGQGFSKLGNPGSGKKIQKFQGYIAETAWNSMPPLPTKLCRFQGGPSTTKWKSRGYITKYQISKGLSKNVCGNPGVRGFRFGGPQQGVHGKKMQQAIDMLYTVLPIDVFYCLLYGLLSENLCSHIMALSRYIAIHSTP